MHSQAAGPSSKTHFLTGFLESLEVKLLERLAQRWEGVWLCTNKKKSTVGGGRKANYSGLSKSKKGKWRGVG